MFGREFKSHQIHYLKSIHKQYKSNTFKILNFRDFVFTMDLKIPCRGKTLKIASLLLTKWHFYYINHWDEVLSIFKVLLNKQAK